MNAANSPQAQQCDRETPDAPQIHEANHVPPTSRDALEPEDTSGQMSPPEPQGPSDGPVDTNQVGSLVSHMAEQQ